MGKYTELPNGLDNLDLLHGLETYFGPSDSYLYSIEAAHRCNVHRELVAALEEVLIAALKYRLQEEDLVVEDAREAIAKATSNDKG